jgi:oligopeptide transport system substrate-binding protein
MADPGPESIRSSARRAIRRPPFAPPLPAPRLRLLAPVVFVVAALLVSLLATTAHSAGKTSVSILSGEPTTFDPAAQGDVGTAAVTSQIFEGLTALDPALVVRPALASSWDVADGGRTITFHLRGGLEFSDGSPLTAADVVRSWLRLIEPTSPSPLASLMDDVVGASAYRQGQTRDRSTVGLEAAGSDVVVHLVHPFGEFVSVVAGSSFAIVPSTGTLDGTVGSGGYVVSDRSSTEITLRANDHYWAGAPAIGTVHLLTTIGGRSPVDAFQKGDLDYTPISDYDASWIAYDPDLGPQLRSVPSLSLEYLGFDVRRAPFDDVRVRQAFALAIDWDRLVELASTGSEIPATSMVPVGVPGRADKDFGQSADPARARELLSEAGFPGGKGFPDVIYLSGGTTVDEGILRQIHDNLGITLQYETMDFTSYFAKLATDPPQIWSLGWTADYPGPNDFLGILLGSGVSNNYGRWSSPAFDAAIADAGKATDPTSIRAAYDRAEQIVQQEVPVVPISYGSGWALSRNGLLGANQNGLGALRLAGLAWKQ